MPTGSLLYLTKHQPHQLIRTDPLGNRGRSPPGKTICTKSAQALTLLTALTALTALP